MAQSSRNLRVIFPLLIAPSLLMFLAGTGPVHAAFHFWQVKEVFSNADGSVQFIELFDSFAGEEFVGGQTLRSNSDGVIKNFTIPSNLNTSMHSTAGRHMLIATPNIHLLTGGVDADFDLPFSATAGPFFNPNATNITISFLASGDAMVFTGAALPKNGINSLTDTNLNGSLASGVNSPRNFDDVLGSVNAPAPTGDYDGNHTVDAADYVIWRKTLNQTGVPPTTAADGNGNSTIDAGDYTHWRTKFGNAAGSVVGGTSVVPEPLAGLLLLSGLFVVSLLSRRR